MANSNENPNNLFREKSVERISSPEDLNDYVRVANPGVWMILIAITALLIGVSVWAFRGEMLTTVSAVIITDDGHTDCFVSDTNIAKVSEGMTVRCGDDEYQIVSISNEPIYASGVLSEYAQHVSGIKEGEWIHAISLDKVSPDGTYAAEVITEKIKPIQFIFD